MFSTAFPLSLPLNSEHTITLVRAPEDTVDGGILHSLSLITTNTDLNRFEPSLLHQLHITHILRHCIMQILYIYSDLACFNANKQL